MSSMVKIASKGGHELQGALAEPAGSSKVGALVVLQEWHGLNDQMKGKVDAFAKAGYLAICPDLYHGKVAKDDGEAGKLMGGLDWGKAIGEIADAVAHLRGHARCNGKVGVTGFCMGGALTLAASVNVPDLACAVAFYGLPQIPPAGFGKVKTPIQAHFAKVDDWAKASVAEEIKATVNGAGGHMELYVYDAGHAFMRETDPSKYDAAASKLAWERTFEFLGKHLA